MTKLTIVGEAPSLQGDGRPFTGPSGDRLQQLLGLESYEQLMTHITLTNIFIVPKGQRWDTFDRSLARQKARTMLSRWVKEGPQGVILCGRKVVHAFGVEVPGWFSLERRGPVTLWTFPHPSGLNHFWNDPASVQQASEFLRRLAIGICTHHPSEQCPLT